MTKTLLQPKKDNICPNLRYTAEEDGRMYYIQIINPRDLQVSDAHRGDTGEKRRDILVEKRLFQQAYSCILHT